MHPGHQTSRKGTFFQSANHTGKVLVTLTFMGIFSVHLESLSRFFSQIISVNIHCAYELVGRRFHLSEWLVWAFQSGKRAESCQSGERRKETHVPAWTTSRKPQPASTRCRDHLPPHPKVLPQGLPQGLLSTKHNTNVCFVRPQFKCPYLFQ